MAIDLPNTAQGAGIPSQWSDTISATAGTLLSGDLPALLTEDMVFAASQNIPALTPVGFDGSDRLIPAVSGTTQAIGITVIAVVTDASTNYKAAPVYRQGRVNPDAMNWPASYDTDAKKFNAFRGAPAPTSFIVRRPRAHSI